MRNNANSQSALDARIENHKEALTFIQGITIEDYSSLDTNTQKLVKLYEVKLKCLEGDHKAMMLSLIHISEPTRPY